jgi:hypothetical protein
MKKPLSLVFLFLILLKIGGFVAILSVQREIVRESVIQEIAQNTITKELICIVATVQNASKIEWEEANKEFWFEGKLYDVVKIETKNGQRHYYCLADDAETDIVTTIKNLVQNGQEPLSQTMKGIIGWIFQQIISPEIVQLRFENYSAVIKTQSGFKHGYYIFDYLFKVIKPPQKS